MCRSRYCWRARECACWTCSLRGLSARAVRARSWRHNPSRRRKQPAAAPCKPGACRAPPTAVLEVPVTSWTTTAGLAKRGPPNISMTCVQEGRQCMMELSLRSATASQHKMVNAAVRPQSEHVRGITLAARCAQPHHLASVDGRGPGARNSGSKLYWSSRTTAEPMSRHVGQRGVSCTPVFHSVAVCLLPSC